MTSSKHLPTASNSDEHAPSCFSSYRDLERFGSQLLQEAGRGSQQIANSVSALNGWRKIHGILPDATVGDEFGSAFDVRFLHYQDVLAERLATRTQKDRCEQLLWWRKTYESLIKQDTLPLKFASALSVAFAHARISKAALCRATGVSIPTINRWLSGNHLPESNSASLVTAVEEALGLPVGTLLRRLPLRRHSRYARSQEGKSQKRPTRYGERLHRNQSQLKEYALEPTARLRAQWLELATMKSDLSRPHATARNTWRLKPLHRTGIRMSWSMLVGGQICVTAGIQYAQIASYLGFLALPVDKGGFGLEKSQLDTLAWLVRSDYVKAFVEWQQRRADGILHNGLFTFLNTVRSHLRKETGFLWLHPELADTLTDAAGSGTMPVRSGEEWRACCEVAYQNLLAVSRRLRAAGKPERSRDPRECIHAILASPFPLKCLVQMLHAIESDPPPVSHRRDYTAWVRDVLLLKILVNHPLRASHFSVMTFRGPDPNLYRNAEGGWQLRFPPSDFKNQKGAANTLYEVSLHDSIGRWVNRYLSESRPYLIGADDCDYLFRPSVVGNRAQCPEDGTPMYEQNSQWSADCITIRVKHLTSRYGPDGACFGIQAFRHIIATDHLKRNPKDYVTVAQMLHDKLPTVMKEYVHLEVADGVRTIRLGIELAEKQIAAERGGDNMAP
ncbi:MAG: hypothetical protein WC100_15835 [Sterolibacterium sp.]